MDLAQVFLSVAGWIFFAVWGLALTAVCVVAFARDMLPDEAGKSARNNPVGMAAKRSA